MALGFDIVRGKDFNLGVNLTYNYNKNNIDELMDGVLAHFVIDSLSVLLSAVASVWVVELVTALVTGGAVLMARYACMEE